MDLEASSTCWSELIDYCTLFPVLFICVFSLFCLIRSSRVLFTVCESAVSCTDLHESGYVWFMMVINNQPETFELQTEFLAWLMLLILSLHFYPTPKQRAKCCITSKNKNNHLIKKDKRNKIKSKTMIEKQKLNPVWSWEWWWREGFSSVWRLVMRKMSWGGRRQQCEPISS